MTAHAHAKSQCTPQGRRRRRAFLGLGVFLLLAFVCAFGFYRWREHAYNQWLLEDTDGLEPYETVLYPEERRVQGSPQAALDEALIAHTLEGRLGVELTRSEYHWGLGRNRAWVKTCLVTSRPDDENAHRRIKLLHRIERTEDGWEVASVQELAMP